MLKKTVLLLLAATGTASSAWAQWLGAPYVGEVATDWSTSSAVSATGSASYISPNYYGPQFLLNGGLFSAATGGAKPQSFGSPNNSDGWKHTSSAAYNSWLGVKGAYTSPAGVSCAAWAEFTFDQVYNVDTITVWNGLGTPGLAAQTVRSFKDTTISWSTDGTTWSSMNYTLTTGPGFNGDPNFAPPSDPAVPFGQAAKYVVLSGLNNYGDPNFMTMSEVRFNLVPEPSTLALLGLGGLGLLLRRKR